MKISPQKILSILSLTIVVCTIFISKKLSDYYSFAPYKQLVPKKNNNQETLLIIFIGDSWAAYHSNYNYQLEEIIKNRLNVPVTCHSNGIIGAKTKTVYLNMFNASSLSGTNRLLNQVPSYCIISTGINDAVAKMGTDNYCYHYGLVINNLLSAGIKPIILDMPDVDYKAVYQRESIISQIRHHISSWLTKAPLWDFEEYRKALRLMINQKELKDQIIYIPSSKWNPKGYADSRQLYKEDHIHLNNRGYHLLDSCIASYICNDYLSIPDSL